jgi:hypothetical protein
LSTQELAIQLPQLPLSLMQQQTDSWFDVKYGPRRTFACRVGFTLIMSALLLVGMGVLPSLHTARHELPLLAVATSMGALSAMLFGTFMQLVSMLPAARGRANAAFLLGTQSCGPLLLGLSWAVGLVGAGAVHPTPASLYGLFGGSAGLLGLALACYVWLARQPVYRDSLQRMAHAAQAEPLLASEELEEGTTTSSSSQRRVRGVVLPGCLSLSLTVLGTIMVFPFFPFVPSSSGSANLASTLFYIQCTVEALGTQLTVWPLGGSKWELKSSRGLVLAAGLRLVVFLPAFFLYIVGTEANGLFIPKNDAVFCACFGLFFLLHGYLTANCNKLTVQEIEAHPELGKQFAAAGMKLLSLTFLGTLTVGICLGAGLNALLMQQKLIFGKA